MSVTLRGQLTTVELVQVVCDLHQFWNLVDQLLNVELLRTLCSQSRVTVKPVQTPIKKRMLKVGQIDCTVAKAT